MQDPKQIHAALKKANDHRIGRARVKEAIKAGETNVARVLADLPPCINTMGVEELLKSCPGIGSHKANTLLAHMQIYGIHHQTQLASLTERQRISLVAHLREMYPRSWKRMNG